MKVDIAHIIKQKINPMILYKRNILLIEINLTSIKTFILVLTNALNVIRRKYKGKAPKIIQGIAT